MDERLIVFELDDGHYGVEIGHVQEIDRWQPITALPQAPDHVQGVINLRGQVVPVVDLRERFGLGEAEVTPRTRIVVAKTAETWVGLIVDAVSEVLRVPSEAIEPPPDMASTPQSGFLRGIAKVADRLIILLDLDRVLGNQVAAASSAAG